MTSTTVVSSASAQEDCTPSRMMIVLDKSSSMQTGTIGGQTKWQIATDALSSVIGAFDTRIEMGLMMFPSPDQCSPGTVSVQPALGNRSALLSELGTAPPPAGNYTPMAQTLTAAAGEPSLATGDMPRSVVLITDGWQWCHPYDASLRFAGVDAVAQLNAAGVRTFVVGFGDSVDSLLLNSAAVEAGTARPGCNPTGDSPTASNPCYYHADNPGQLVNALNEIADQVSEEVCDNEDNDCDGNVDENLTRSCASDCGSGTETCEAGNWVGCDAPLPAAEVCDGEDNNCDGAVDTGCDCAAGESRSCGSADACEAGTQTCKTDGTWGDCEGEVTAGPEMCDGDDNDCDGRIDETFDDVGGLCPPGYQCAGGDCSEIPPATPPGGEATDDTGDGGLSASGCGCQSGGRGSMAGSLLLALMAAFVIRRRRR